jgi:hypothetical protein
LHLATGKKSNPLPLPPKYKEILVAKLIKTVFSLRYGVIILALVIGGGFFGLRPLIVWAQSLLYPANMEQFLAQDARMQKEVVRLGLKGQGAEAAVKLKQIADRDLQMAANLPPSLKRNFERSAARFQELAMAVSRQ